MKFVAIAMSLSVFGAAAGAAAQDAPGDVAVDAGGALFVQAGATGTESVTYVTAPGGTTLGWAGGVVVQLPRRFAAAAELGASGVMRAVEPSRYFTTWEEERRDVTVALSIRRSFRVHRLLAVEPLVGLALVKARAWSQATSTDPLALRVPQPRVQHDLDVGLGPVVGVDLPMGSGRLQVLPSFRLWRSAITHGRYDGAPETPRVEIGAIYPGGYPAWTTRAGVSVRIWLRRATSRSPQ